MSEVNQLISSYLNARAAILRVLEDKNLKASSLTGAMPLSIITLRRKLKTSDWRADELSQLGSLFGINVDLELKLSQVNERLRTLPEQDCKQLVRETHIGPQRFRSLMRDSCDWRDNELFQVSNFLRKYVPTSTD